MSHPYHQAAPHRLWRKAVSALGPDTDPVSALPFRIRPTDKVMTAGSCFAQHISRRLQASGFDFLLTEPGHPLLPRHVAESHNYGRFTARYGNIYSAPQLLQLLRRAVGGFTPIDGAWQEAEDRWIDPFRPTIQPDGFTSRRELERDREQHLAAVRQAFETLDVCVFTLGLTEAWHSLEDGAVYPVCPGTAGGRFDPARHGFQNHDVATVVRDLTDFIDELRLINPGARVMLTVSPVPLVATATDDHVLQATTYSKSVLRVAAGMVAASRPDVGYFPSFEIITGPQARGRYFADDLRSVNEEGVDRVMALFFAHACQGGTPKPTKLPTDPTDDFVKRSRAAMDLLCDEELLDRNA